MDTSNVKEHLLELERRYWQAIKDRDAEAAMKLSDDPCILAGAQGVSELDRKTLGSMMEAARYKLTDFRITNAIVRMLDDEVAVLAYEVHEDLEVGGAPLSLDANDASTWVRKNGDWVCAAHTESLAGDPFGRDRR